MAVCAACSPNTIQLDGQSEAQRACTKCVSSLHGAQKQVDEVAPRLEKCGKQLRKLAGGSADADGDRLEDADLEGIVTFVEEQLALEEGAHLRLEERVRSMKTAISQLGSHLNAVAGVELPAAPAAESMPDNLKFCETALASFNDRLQLRSNTAADSPKERELRQDLADKATEIERLKAELAQERHNQEAQAQQDLATNAAEIGRLKAELAQERQTREELEGKLSDAEYVKVELAHARDGQAQAELAKSLTEIERFKVELAQQQQSREELERKLRHTDQESPNISNERELRETLENTLKERDELALQLQAKDQSPNRAIGLGSSNAKDPKSTGKSSEPTSIIQKVWRGSVWPQTLLIVLQLLILWYGSRLRSRPRRSRS